MPTLSLVMIVKNEALRLGECLDSVRGIADEMVVGDTGSADGTVEIARRFGARVIDVPWCDDFAAARNQVLERATGDWLLHLDADEVIDPSNAALIRSIVDADGSGADAVEVTLANYADDFRAWRWAPVDPGNPWARGHAGYIAVGLLRLFRNRRGFAYREAVHENITESVAERGGIVAKSPIVIHHYGYSCDPETARAKAAVYARIAEAKARQRPHDPKAWQDLAEQAFACGDAVAAERACRQALELAPHDLAAATMLGNLLLNRGDLDEARLLFERLEQAGDAAPHIGIALGAIACRQGRLDDARIALETVLRTDPRPVQAWLYLARVRDLLADAAGARECLEQAHQAAPGLEEPSDRIVAHALRIEGESQCRAGELQRALRTLVAALRLDREDPVTHSDLGEVLAGLGEAAKAAQSFRRALLLASCMAEARRGLARLESAP